MSTVPVTATSLAGIPFALVCFLILVWSVVLLVGTLGTMTPEADESDEEAPE